VSGVHVDLRCSKTTDSAARLDKGFCFPAMIEPIGRALQEYVVAQQDGHRPGMAAGPVARVGCEPHRGIRATYGRHGLTPRRHIWQAR
jgi:hypothetical protein